MVKFQKQLAGQLVPEWEEAYCNYKQLKQDVKRIKEHHQLVDDNLSVAKISTNSVYTLKFIGSPLGAFTGKLVNHSRFLWDKVEHIVVHAQPGADAYEEFYETELLESALTPTELATDFFQRLDAQLNMVNRFYKIKEEEYNLRAHSLQLQMEALLDLRKALARHSSQVNHISSGSDEEKSETTLSAWSARSGQGRAVTKKQVQNAEKLLRTAFAEFYRGLSNLKSYSALNIMAFSKILKKYDKVTGWNASLTYLRVVEGSYFACSHKVVKLMDRVENLFTQHLAKQNHREAMVYLKPVQQISSTNVSYLQGLFTGCSVALFVTIAITFIPSRFNTQTLQQEARNGALLPVSSTVGLVLLHLYMYGWNVYLWRRARINYTLIFEWAPGTELRCQEVLLLSTGLTTLWMLAMSVVKLCPGMPHSDLVPLILLMVYLVILFFPMNYCYRSTRVVLIRCIIHIVCSPLHKVALADSFLADQITSQVAAMKNIQYLACYYFGGYFHDWPQDVGVGVCTDGHIYFSFRYFVSVLPSWWRLMQCARRVVDERNFMQVLNAGKYISSLVAATIKVAYAQHGGQKLFYLFLASTTISTLYNLYWDTVVDWGLLQSNSVNPWLRDQLLLKNKMVYYIAMAINFLLRTAWIVAVVLEKVLGVDHDVADLVLAVLEVFRRGQWNFYRLENEHLHNFGKFKALRQAPLPFQDVEGA